MAMKIKQVFILGWLLGWLCGCNHQQNVSKIVDFSCSKIYIDTTNSDVSVVFKMQIKNHTKKNYYFFANSSSLHRDSVFSNFYLLDTAYNAKYQLLLGPGPSLNPLFSEKKLNLPVLLIQETTWKELMQTGSNQMPALNRSKLSLAIDFLKRSQLIYVSDKKDFQSHHINLRCFIKDTIHISFSQNTLVYFTIPSVKDFINDSLFRQQHPYSRFLLR